MKKSIGIALSNAVFSCKSFDDSIIEQRQEVHEFTNRYPLSDVRSPSKSRLKKCAAGLHEFSDTGSIENDRKVWACIHCGVSMHNR